MKAGFGRTALLVGAFVILSCGVPRSEAPKTEVRPTDPTGSSAPTGKIERADVVVPGFVSISGWVDGQSPEELIFITPWLDGEPRGTVRASAQWASNADQWPGLSFAFDLPLPEGPHEVCVTVAPDEATAIDCIEVNSRPTEDVTKLGPVVLTAVIANPKGVVVVRGVVTRVEQNAKGRIDVSTTVGMITATEPDGGAYEGSPVVSVATVDQSFRFWISGLSAGRYAICPGATRVSVQRRPLQHEMADGCGTVVISEPNLGMNAGTTGLAIAVEAVGPAPDHPLFLMERDAGVSVELRDGSTIWFFGDTMLRRGDGGLRFFINNTAAWASSDAPLLTLDAVISGGEPALFVAAPASNCAGARFPNAGLWPESSVAIPQPDGTDRVVVVMSKVCLGRGWLDIETVGYALAEFTYDPRDPPADRPIRGSVTQPDLAPAEAGFGRAVFSHPDGHLYGYHCGEFPVAWGPCQVAKVQRDEVAEVGSWLFWNGGDWRDPSSWEGSASAAAAMVVPGAEVQMLPVAAFAVEYVPRFDAYLMVYTPWPGFCGELAVRASATPVGPWTEPLVITLPECGTQVGEPSQVCYAATAQMQLCGGAGFAGGYFDSLTNLGVGRYLTFVSPFVVSRPAD